MPSLRTLLVLGRTSNLPTVWSNCLAGWWLGGRGNESKLLPFMAGATMLYIGGMYLNDAFDEGFDAQFRRERPIPSGAIQAKTVWQIGLGLLVGGLAVLFFLGLTTGILGMILVGFILVYDAVHKMITLSPLLMAGCRFFLYLAAASIAVEGVTGYAVWCAFALAVYIVGLSFLARKESTRAAVAYWPCLALAAPIIIAMFMNADVFLKNALMLSAILALWVIRASRYAFAAVERNIGRAVAGLLAGIVLVDLLAVADATKPFAAIFLVLFLLALLFQRYIPAT